MIAWMGQFALLVLAWVVGIRIGASWGRESRRLEAIIARCECNE